MKPHAHSSRPHAPIFAAICAGAFSRLLWAAAALAVLWLMIYWALS